MRIFIIMIHNLMVLLLSTCTNHSLNHDKINKEKMDCLSRLKMDKNTNTDSRPFMKKYGELSAVHDVHMIT